MTVPKGRPRGAILGLSAALALGACAEGTVYRAPAFPFLKSYAARQSGAPVLVANDAWWQRFGDRTLDALMARGLAQSLSIELARARVEEARGNAEALTGPVSAAPSTSLRRTYSDEDPDDTTGTLSLGFDWLLDPYGGRRDQVKALGGRVEAADAELDAAQLLLLANLAAAYVDLRYNQRALQLRREALSSRNRTRALVQQLFDQGSATRLDLVRADALVAETEAEVPALIAAIAASKNQIAVLAGSQPGLLGIDLDTGARQPRPGLSPDVGIPADLLRNRPDIRIAERLYYAAVHETGVARAAQWPTLSLGGAISLSAVNGSRDAEYYFGPVLRFPSLVGNGTAGTVKAREALARQAHLNWQSTVLGAISEVETALVAYASGRQSVLANDKTVRLYREVADLTRELISGDGATVRDLIDAEQSIAQANLALADSVRRQGQSFVALNVALGSGHGFGRE